MASVKNNATARVTNSYVKLCIKKHSSHISLNITAFYIFYLKYTPLFLSSLTN